MGLFSSKYVTQVGTTTQRMLEDDQLPDSVKSGVFAAIMGESVPEDSGVVDYVMEGLFQSLGVRAESLYDWAKTNYIYGLPSGEYRTARTLQATVSTRLASHVGGAPVIEYCAVGPPNDLHNGWVSLIRDHGYNPVTNRITGLEATIGKPVYLDDLVMRVADTALSNRPAGSLEQWGTPPRRGVTPMRPASSAALYTFSPPELDSGATADYVRVFYVWESQAAGQPVKLTQAHFDIPLTEWSDKSDYIQVGYLKDGVRGHWNYLVGSGLDPVLDAVTGTAHDELRGTFFPFLYFRFDKQSQSRDKSSRGYLDSVKFAKKLGLNFDQLADAINQNPEVLDVEQAMMTFAVPASSTNPLECHYLYEFFSSLYLNSATPPGAAPQTENLVGKLTQAIAPKESAIVIEDSRFKMVLANTGIYRRLVAGSIGAVGSCTATFETAQQKHYYRRQITETAYEQLEVVGLRFTYFIFGEHTALTDGVDDILLIPLDRSITQQFSLAEREKLYARSLQLVFNSKVVTKVKWYQQGWFRDFLLIVAIVITIYNMGADGGQLIAAVLAGNAALVIQLGWVLLQRIALQFLASQVVKLFVKELGLEGAFIVTILAMVAFQSYDQAALVFPDAKSLLQATQALLNSAAEVTQEKLLKLYEESANFEKWVKAQTQLLEEAQDLLDTPTQLNPYILFSESPDDFYNRTVHAGNIGVLGYGAISSFVDTALKLPTLDETTGETIDEQNPE